MRKSFTLKVVSLVICIITGIYLKGFIRGFITEFVICLLLFLVIGRFFPEKVLGKTLKKITEMEIHIPKVELLKSQNI